MTQITLIPRGYELQVISDHILFNIQIIKLFKKLWINRIKKPKTKTAYQK